MAHTHGFEPEPSGLKDHHLTTRPRTPELCDLRAETRELSRGKKHTQFPITLAYRKCNKIFICSSKQYTAILIEILDTFAPGFLK